MGRTVFAVSNTVLLTNSVRVKYTVRHGRARDDRRADLAGRPGPGPGDPPAPRAAARAQGAADHRADRRRGDGADGDEGYDAVSMRSLARALDTGPASLYAHVANRDELDQLVIDRIASELQLPEPDPDRWDEQLKDASRDAAALPGAPGLGPGRDGDDPDDGGELARRRGDDGDRLAGGFSPQAAAWFCDLAAAYVGAIAYEEAIWTQRENSTKAGEKPDHEASTSSCGRFRVAPGRPVPAGAPVRRRDHRRRRRRAVRVRHRRTGQRAGGGLREVPLTDPGGTRPSRSPRMHGPGVPPR